MKKHTQVIHSGQKPEATTGAVVPPIFMTSTYAQEYPGQHKGYDYTRAGNPNFSDLERLLAALEGADHATVFSSGLGAITSLLTLCKRGDRVVALNGLYGGTYRLFTRIFAQYGLEFDIVELEEMERALKKPAKLLFFESPTNPLLGISDIRALCDLSKKYGVFSIVDNTFATPCFQNPLALGADAVVHSTTKYIGGHSDVVGGVVMTSSAEVKEQMDFARMAVGLNPSPFDTWLTLRGVKTLAVRMDRHAQNAQRLAAFLDQHVAVKRVYYPGLPSHPKHEIALKQMSGFGGMLSAEFDLDLEATKKMIAGLDYFTLAESLGAVESLVCHPASMTHASIPPDERAKIGLADGLIRFSVGIEDPEDLIQDLQKSLEEALALKC